MNFSLSLLTVVLVLGIFAGQGYGKAKRLLLRDFNQIFDGDQPQSAYGTPNNCQSEVGSYIYEILHRGSSRFIFSYGPLNARLMRIWYP